MPNTPRHTGVSLRFALASSIALICAVGVGGTFAVERYVQDRLSARTAVQDRALRLHADSDQRLLALLNEEVGLRGFLATGDERFLAPYEAGRRQELDGVAAIQRDLGDAPDDEPVRQRFALALAAADRWRTQIAEAQVAERRRGPLVDLPSALIDGKTRFDELRAARDDFRAALDASLTPRLDACDRAVVRAHQIELGVLATLLMLIVASVAWILRRTVTPIVVFAEAAARGDAFTPIDGGGSFREIALLSGGLMRLEERVAERERALIKEHDEAEALRGFVERMQQHVDEQLVAEDLERTLRRRHAPSVVQVLRRSPSENRLDRVAPPMDPAEARKHLVLLEPQRCRSLRAAAVVRVDDARSEAACICSVGVPENGGYLCVPMMSVGEVIGLVNLQVGDERKFWSTEERANIESYVAAASAALSSLSLLRSARESALRDGLTGTYNRRFLDEVLPKQVAQTLRREASMSALMVDIDHFKRVNDGFGHAAGDRVLVAFARALSRGLRSGDVVARYGGEEFAVILPDTNVEGARTLAERLRAAVEALTFDEVRIAITMSVGLAAIPDHARDGDGLLRAADSALYRAKNEGRNRVIVAT